MWNVSRRRIRVRNQSNEHSGEVRIGLLCSVKSVMTIRIITTIVATAFIATSACGARREFFPPYPDMWEWTVPTGREETLVNLDASLLDGGDVLISAALADKSGKHRTKSWLLFSQDAVDPIVAEGADRVVLPDGKNARVIGSAKREVPLGKDSTITSISRGYRLCYRGPVRSIVVKRDKLGHSVAERVIFVVLDEARRFVGGGGQSWSSEQNASCPDEGPVDIRYRVAAAAGSFLSLPDGTALLLDSDTALIIRFREDLNLGRRSPSGKVFSFEYRDNDYFIDDALGKRYYDDEDETPRYQEMLDDLYQYLMRLRKEH